MDARHISHEKKVLNAIIRFINLQVKSKAWVINGDVGYLEKLSIILDKIYDYASMSINVREFLSTQNITEVKIVPLPEIETDIIPNPDAFNLLFQQIMAVASGGKANKSKLQERLERKFLRLYESSVKEDLLNQHSEIMFHFAKSLNGYITENQHEMLLNEKGRRDDVDFISQLLHDHLGITKLADSHRIDLGNLNKGIYQFRNHLLAEQVDSLQSFVTKINQRMEVSLSGTPLQSALSPLVESSHDVLIHLNKMVKKT